MPLITNTHTLYETCQRLAQHSYVTVDTEFLRETTFWPKLCVIQLATEAEAVAVDALAPDLDLTPFFELMRDPNVVKVLDADVLPWLVVVLVAVAVPPVALLPVVPAPPPVPPEAWVLDVIA